MGWTPGVDRAAGYIVPAALWNTELGATGSLEFVHDALDDCVMRDGSTVAYASPSGTRVKGTVYQNTSGKIRMVTIFAYCAAVGDTLSALVGVANPPTVNVGGVTGVAAAEGGNITFFVPPGYYYKANEEVATMTISYWTEWDIL